MAKRVVFSTVIGALCYPREWKVADNKSKGPIYLTKVGGSVLSQNRPSDLHMVENDGTAALETVEIGRMRLSPQKPASVL
ncbi:uncharacterized protein DS421_9g274960 [Arachis hypogaea]|nr:uncharacterized protein DS421_9g274960 [Arachis hypogaea]